MAFIKTSGHELHQQTKEIKSQLTEQIKCLEQRTDTQVCILNEINDFVKKRAEIELEYSKQLEKLTKSFMIKHKNEKPRRANWSQFSTCTILQQMVDDTKLEAYQRGICAQIYGTNVTQSINSRTALLQKISKKCREIGVQAQGELIRVLNELQVSMKAYQMCYVDFINVKDKLHNAELSKQKSVDTNSLRKQKSLQKAFDKRLTKFEASQIKCNRARNEYLLCIEAANSAMHKFFAQDLSDLIDCTDISLDSWVNAILTNIIAARKAVCQQEMTALASLSTIRESFQLAVDRHKFFESNSSAFMLPKAFEFRHDPTENINHIIVNGCLADDLRIRQRQINKRLDTLKKESDELAIELDRQEEHICNLLSAATIVEITKDGIFDGRPPREITDESIEEATIVYTDRFRHHMLNGNLIIRLEARAFTIGNALKTNPLEVVAESPHAIVSPNSLQSPQSNDIEWFQRQRRKKRVGSGADPVTQNIFQKRPKLFCGSLVDYVEATGEEIPIVVTSCIRALSQFALHHQGVFRISGSQVEINNMKEAFEIGDDPLANSEDITDVNSIAGVLKLYLRELREPLFPVYLFEQLTECAKCSSTQDFINQITPLLNKLPRSTYLLLRYLFAFLNHLSQFSDENMMDPFNLAICFGPTLLPIPEDKDQVYYQASVNDVVKNLIEYHDSIFNPNISGPIYRIYEDDLAYADDGDECFTPGNAGSETGTVRNNEDARIMTTSLHSSIHPQNNGIPGMDRRLANAAAAVAQNRRSFYDVTASSSNGILSPSMNITSYEEGDERMMLPMRTILTPTSQSGFNSLITPLSTNSSMGHTSLSGDSTVSSLTAAATTQKEEMNETQRNQSPPQKINPSKSGNVLQERSSIDSGIGAKDSQQKSPASSNSSEQSKSFSNIKTEKIRIANAAPKVRPMQTVPLSAQISFQETERISGGARSVSSGKTTPSSNASSPRVISSGYSNSITEEESTNNICYREKSSSSSVPQGQHV